ncbi:hypothetical protein CK203_052459 [Vitis vinifera]|uniref:Reverse transcriptase/retrotransposon-derived protein RNase H-like domain-containing protein n=1 Tax=Vitis vinifera TaxID=29760 RepID=A0A438HCH5_VITVI|nr:hypothetical protein CK203_052459 [Vitis vinifera]
MTDYFVRASEPQALSNGIIGRLRTTQEAELQCLVQQLRLSDGALGTSTPALIAHSSPDHLSLMTLCFPDEIDEHGTFAEVGDIVDGAVPCNEVSFIEIVEEIQTAPALEIQTAPALEIDEGVITVDGSVSYSEDVHDHSFMDLSIFEYFDIDDEIAQHDSDDDSFSVSDSDPVDQKVSPAMGDTETVDFGTSYEDMLGLDPSIVQHRLSLLPHTRPVKQKLRRLHPRWSLQDSKVRVCVDFRDLNKTSPKDDFSFPHIDMLVDSTGRVMPFGLKNAGATYQRAVIALFHDMMHRDVEFRLRLNPKKCIFGVTSGKLLRYMVSKRGIEVDPDKIKAILDMPARGQREECQCAFERIREYLSPPVLTPSTPSRPLILYLSVLDVASSCMLAQLDDSGKGRAIYYLSKRMLDYETRYVMIERYCLALVWATRRLRHLKSIRGSIVVDHLASLMVSDGRTIDDDFPDEDVAAVTSLSGWRMYFDGASNHSGYGIGVLLISPHSDHIPRSLLRLRIRQMEVFGDSNLVLRQIQGEWKTRDVRLRPYHAYLELLAATTKDKRAFRQLAARFVIYGETLYRRLADGMLLLYLDHVSADRVMRDVHAGVYRPHMGGHMLAHTRDLIYVPPSELHALTSQWSFLVWGIDIIRKISPKSSSGHEFILVSIDYSPSGWRSLYTLD